MKKILISVLAFDEGKSGIADYIISICRELSQDNKLELLIHPSDAKIFPVKSSNITYRFIPEFLKRPLFSMFWHLYCLPFLIDAKQYSLILLPAGNRRLLARYPKNTIVVFHDLSQFHIPSKYDDLRMFYIKKIIPHYIKKAPAIVAISENTKNDMIRYYHIEPHRIVVNYNGFSPEKLVSEVSEDSLRSKYHLTRPYLLYISRIEHPGKNHLNLIKAFEALPESIRLNYDLVCAGGNWNGAEQVISYAENSKDKEHLKFTGFVDNKYLGALYLNAELYLFPSLYEGFGIPLLEAMACSLPVVCSNTSSLPEIGGDAVVTFDPNSVSDISSKIILVLQNPELRKQMVQKGQERIKLFSWRSHTHKLLEINNKR